MNRLTLFLAILALAIAAIGGAWSLTYRNQLIELQEFGTYKISQALDQFDGQVNKFRLLPTLLARRKSVREIAATGQVLPGSEDYFLSTMHLTGSTEIQLASPEGNVILDARKYSEKPARQDPLAQRDYFIEALTGALGFDYYLDPKNGIRNIFFARSVLGADSKPSGVVTVETDIEQFETDWRSLPETVLFVDRQRRVFLSNRSDLVNRFLSLPSETDQLKTVGGNFSGADSQWIARPITPEVDETDIEFPVWSELGFAGDQGSYLAISKDVPVHDMNAYLLVSTTPARSVANLTAMLAAAIFALITIAVYAYDLRRRRLVQKLDMEQELNSVLESRISKRTDALEMAQAKLTEAAKMSALGKMSASIGHELNQPIASIQNFAVNSRKFLEKGNLEAVEDNLCEIDSLTHRMNQIIKNLRAFSRNEKTEVFVVNLRDIVEVATQLTKPRLVAEGVTLTVDEPLGEFLVKGGEVRLQQVLVNLISNAADAVAGSDRKHIHIAWKRIGSNTALTVHDTGHGIADDNKLFEPFYTTKDVDEGYGLGLGLAISYSIIRSFGGTINGENHPDGGAIFTITLRNASRIEAEAAQ